MFYGNYKLYNVVVTAHAFVMIVRIRKVCIDLVKFGKILTILGRSFTEIVKKRLGTKACFLKIFTEIKVMPNSKMDVKKYITVELRDQIILKVSQTSLYNMRASHKNPYITTVNVKSAIHTTNWRTKRTYIMNNNSSKRSRVLSQNLVYGGRTVFVKKIHTWTDNRRSLKVLSNSENQISSFKKLKY